ncbi:MAG: UDP-N-acetylmuramoyl-tripeptide--D-alanyl-D-alanine ligase [Ignavibacteriae bacterium]|nr:UDP-N-acetylmuramoyl-tripeptide--D-alanyl-D-alanine ligase [Ignavibacteriota bacterium]
MININNILKLNCKKVNFDKITIKNFFGVSIDSRNIGNKILFVALKGENTDGHNYLADVFKKSAIAAIVNESWYLKNKSKFKDKIFIVVKDTVKSLGELAKIHLSKITIPVLFVGGSNGKTTTKDLIAAVLARGFNVLKNEGNLNNHIGLPLSVLNLDSHHNMCVLEAGSNHFNEVKYLCEIGEPDYGLVTNIGKEHLEFFKNLNGVAREEFSLFDYLIKKKNPGLCFMNFDDAYTRKYFEKHKPAKCFTYSYNYDTNLKARFIKYTEDFEPVIELQYKSEKILTRINTFGKHPVYNALAAAAVGLYFGINLNQIKFALEYYVPASSKRMEISRKRGLILINDTYNSNPGSVKLGLETLKEYNTKGEIHIVLADMLELGKSSKIEHYEIGKLIKKMNFTSLYSYGKESENIFTGAKGVKNNFHFKDKKELSDFLINTVKRGDVIYFKGSRGMKLEEVVDKISNGF